MGTATLRWQDRARGETEQRIYRAQTAFNSDNLPPVLATVAPDVQEYKDTTVAENTNYFFMIGSYRADPELEVYSDLIEISTARSLGPGPSTLVGGTSTMGFFGEVPTTQLINGTDLAALVGLTTGTSQFHTDPWLKFVLDGELLYVPKRSYRHTISWDQINAAGIVYGDKVIEINGYQYEVSLLEGADANPAVVSDGNDVVGSRNSMWSRIFYPICIDPNIVSYTGPKLATYTMIDLGMTSAVNGYYIWCQETVAPTTRVGRGHTGPSGLAAGTSWAIGAGASSGWRPLLRLKV